MRRRPSGRAAVDGAALALGLCATLAVASGCGDGAAPCDGVAGRCVQLRVETAPAFTIAALDQLELDVRYGTDHGTTVTMLDGGATFAPPLELALEIASATTGPLSIGVVAAGKLDDLVIGTGAASTTLLASQHRTLTLRLAAPDVCTVGELYCGGHKLAGDPQTLYRCSNEAVPQARGVCAFGCLIDAPTDRCSGGSERCIEGGFYCGGDKVEGDPRSLYRCQGGVGVSPQLCANACVVAPPGSDDFCR